MGLISSIYQLKRTGGKRKGSGKKYSNSYKSGPVSTYKPDEFYQSRPWYELRYKALKQHGAKCQCCGRSRKDGAIMHVDHIYPRSTHPHMELDLANLQVLCDMCNLGKGNKDVTDWRNKPGA